MSGVGDLLEEIKSLYYRGEKAEYLGFRSMTEFYFFKYFNTRV